MPALQATTPVQVHVDGVPLWVAIALPVLTAVGGLLGGGVVRAVLDRRAERARAVGYARVIRQELTGIAARLEDGDRGLLPTSAWDDHRSDIAGALLEHEYTLLSSAYSLFNAVNRRAGASRVLRRLVPMDDQTRIVATSLVLQALSAVDWLAIGDIPLLRQRTVGVVQPVPYEARCKCGHRWDHHRWTMERRRRWRVRLREFNAREVAHECNVEDCACKWFRQPGRVRLPRALQRHRLGLQFVQKSDEADPEDEPPEGDPAVPRTAWPGAVVTSVDAE